MMDMKQILKLQVEQVERKVENQILAAKRKNRQDYINFGLMVISQQITANQLALITFGRAIDGIHKDSTEENNAINING